MGSMLKLVSRTLFVFAFCGTFAFAQSPSTANLREKIGEIARAAQGRVGAMVTLLETGESVAWQGDQHFPMQSVYKLPIGMAVLEQVDRGRLKLEQMIPVRQRDFVSSGQHSPIRDNHPHGVELSLSE